MSITKKKQKTKINAEDKQQDDDMEDINKMGKNA